MCGLLAYINSSYIGPEKTKRLQNSLDTLAHRGPDAEGFWISDNASIFFGHRRLSILDTSSRSDQPFHRKDLGVSVIFNGEIYNFLNIRNLLSGKGHNFSTSSDTEVLAVAYAEWGSDCISMFDGMFAFVLYDHTKKVIVAARDRVGEKPLFMHFGKQEVVIASELKAILADPDMPHDLDDFGLNTLLGLGYIPAPYSLIKGIIKLPPACFVEIDASSLEYSVSRYWEPPSLLPSITCSSGQLVEELESLLRASIVRQLKADVPITMLLSGGLDSSLLVGLACDEGIEIRTFNFSFSHYDKFDESVYAQELATFFGTSHSSAYLNDFNIIEAIEFVSRNVNEPIGDSSLIPTYLLARDVAKNFKVALGGDGADELFGGYQHHKYSSRFRRAMSNIPSSIAGAAGNIAERSLPVGFPGRNFVRSIGSFRKGSQSFVSPFFDPISRSLLLNAFCERSVEATFSYQLPAHKEQPLMAMRNDFLTYLPYDILAKTDNASMLNSVEMRSPFLSNDIINFSFSFVPDHLKFDELQGKIILKKIASKYFPKSYNFMRKQGFSIPLHEVFNSEDVLDFARSILLSKECIFNNVMIENIFSSYAKGYKNAERIFLLLQLQLWITQNKVKATWQ